MPSQNADAPSADAAERRRASVADRITRRAALRSMAGAAVVGVASPSLLARRAGASGGGKLLRVVVTVAPLAGLVKPLLPMAELTILMKPGRSEHGYEFAPEDLAHLGRADLVIYVGLGLEPQVESFLKKRPSSSRREICFADAVGIKPDAHDHAHHHHAPGEPCNHAVDPHLWLDPSLCRELVPRLSEAIGELSPAADESSRATAQAARRQHAKAIDAVDEEHKTRLAPLKGRSIVTHHAAFGRLAERYGLKVAAVIREAEAAEPTPGQIADVIKAVREHKVGAIFTEPQFDGKVAERLAAQAGVKLGRLDPIGDGDWFKMMRSNLDELVAKLS